MTGLTRRRVVGTAAWGAPVIVAVSAAPAFAASLGAPAVVVSEVIGTRRTTEGDTQRIDVEATFTNNGLVDATALSAVIRWVLLPTTPVGATDDDVQDVSSGWTSAPLPFDSGRRALFTRAAGLPAGETETLTFSFGSLSGRGTLDVATPTTTPAGTNTGAAGTWGSTDPVDMDVTSISNPIDNGNIFIGLKNNGTAPAVTQSVAVTITPATGTTFSFSGGATNNFSASPSTVATTSSPTTITFTRNLPLAAGSSLSFNFTIAEDGNGDISATVTNPSSSNNNTLGGTYQ